MPPASSSRTRQRGSADSRLASTQPAEPAALMESLAVIGREDVSTDNEEFIDGMVAVAVPITDAEGRMVASLACHAPKVRMDLAAARRALPQLRRAAAALSLGPDGPAEG